MSPHVFIIHFPVSLAVVAATLDLVGIALDDRSLRDWAWRFFLAAAVMVFLAFATGEGARLNALGTGAVSVPRMATHEQWGSVGIWGVTVAALLRSLWRNRLNGVFGWLNLALILASTGLLVAITFTGSLVRHAG